MEEKFQEAFRASVEESLQKLSQGILLLEKEPSNKSLLEEIQREAHTLKGSVNMLGWNSIGKIVHQIEGLLTEFTEKRQYFNSAIADLLLATLDIIDLLIESEVSGEESGIDVEGICSELEKAKTELPTGEKIAVSQQREKISKISAPEETIRIHTDKIDNLISLIGELTISQMNAQEWLNKFSQLIPLVKEIDRLKVNKELTEGILTIFREHSDSISSLELLVKKLEETAMSLRMLPISAITTYFPRTVRDLAREYNKKVELEIKGAETELDKKILEMVKDPLLHILRNAVAHGIEKPEERIAQGKPERGRITLNTYQEGDHVYVEIEDDGEGIEVNKVKEIALKKGLVSIEEIKGLTDEELVYLIFKPGFTTTETVTEVSGRGVGLDVVKKNITENLIGQVKVETKVGQGTKFILILPLTLAVIHALLVEVNKEVFAFPATNIELIIRVKPEEILQVEGREAVRINERTVPVVKLAEVLKLPFEERVSSDNLVNKGTNKKMPVVVVNYAGQRIGFIVDRLVNEQDMVIRNLSEPIRKVKNIIGATILGAGEPVLILHIPELMDSAQVLPAGTKNSFGIENSPKDTPPESDHTILLVEDFFTTRELEKSVLESWGYHVDIATNGEEALKKIALRKYDLVITDIQMPHIDGFTLCEKLKGDERYKDIPIIIVSALEKEEEKRKGLTVGADVYITKSAFEQKILIEAIERLIGT
ncbi:MAG TPA: hypothetical protein DHV62_05510 [Elusimicrobia bacterium]|jgi:chemotaxis protein histidine kinase CheA|nr:hypothetical protein [Elusimicrobiota bacterium]